MKKLAKYVYFDLFYVLDYYESFDMNIEKWYKKNTYFFLSKVSKKRKGGGGSERYGPLRNI